MEIFVSDPGRVDACSPPRPRKLLEGVYVRGKKIKMIREEAEARAREEDMDKDSVTVSAFLFHPILPREILGALS